MLTSQNIRQFRTEVERELIERILPFWMEKTIDDMGVKPMSKGIPVMKCLL